MSMTKLYCPYDDCGFPMSVLPSAGAETTITCVVCNQTSRVKHDSPDHILKSSEVKQGKTVYHNIPVGGTKRLVRTGV